MCITHGEETLEGAPGNLVPLISDDADVSPYPVSTEPMILSLLSRMRCFFSMSPPAEVYRAKALSGHS
jgi:hypothetical protein